MQQVRMEKLLIYISIATLVWIIYADSVDGEQLVTTYRNNGWSKEIMKCENADHVIEIDTISVQCSSGDDNEASRTQKNRVLVLCNTHNSCNISDPETTNALNSSCTGDKTVFIQFSCISASSVKRMCSSINETSNRIDLYGPVGEENKNVQTVYTQHCQCNMQSMVKMGIQIVNLQLIFKSHGECWSFKSRTFNITGYPQDGNVTNWFPGVCNTKTYTMLEFTGSVSISFLKEMNLLRAAFHLILTADGNFNLQCSNVWEENDMVKSKTTTTTTTSQETDTSELSPSYKSTGSMNVESTTERLTSTYSGISASITKRPTRINSESSSVTTKRSTVIFAGSGSSPTEKQTSFYSESILSAESITSAMTDRNAEVSSVTKSSAVTTNIGTTTSQSQTALNQSQSPRNNIALLAGILVAVVFGIALVLGILFCWCKRKRKAREGEHQYESTEKATKNTRSYELQNGDPSTITRNGQYPMGQLNSEEDNLVINTDHGKIELTETCDVSGDLYGSNASGMDTMVSYDPSQGGLASGEFTNSQTRIQKPGYNEALPISYNKELYHSSKDTNQKDVATNSKNNMQNQNFGYDEAIPVSHNKDLYEPSVQPEQGNPNDPPYFLYDDSHKRQVDEHTDTGSSASGTNVLHPVILDYAPSYMKTKGDAINTLKPQKNQGSPSNLGGSAQNLQAYSYADPRGRFVEGITPHIRGEGYDVERSVEAPNTEEYKYEQFQSHAGKKTPNHTGSRGNLGPYSYADCGGVKPKSGSTKEVKPVVEVSNQHYESMNAIYRPNDTESKGAGNEDAMPEPSAEYEGIAFVQKETKKPVVVNGVELIENEVYNQV